MPANRIERGLQRLADALGATIEQVIELIIAGELGMPEGIEIVQPWEMN